MGDLFLTFFFLGSPRRCFYVCSQSREDSSNGKRWSLCDFVYQRYGIFHYFLFCFVLFCFVLFCFVLFCFVLFCFVLFCFILLCLYIFLFPFFHPPLLFTLFLLGTKRNGRNFQQMCVHRWRRNQVGRVEVGRY